MQNIPNLIHSLLKATALTVIIYFSAALAIQINLGGDVEYWITIFIAGGTLAYGILEQQTRIIDRVKINQEIL